MVENSGYWKYIKRTCFWHFKDSNIIFWLYIASTQKKKRKKLQLGQSLMQTNGQRRPDQNHGDRVIFHWRDLAIFRQKKLGNFWKFCFFLVSVNSTNFGNFIVKVQKKIGTEKKGDKRKKKEGKNYYGCWDDSQGRAEPSRNGQDCWSNFKHIQHSWADGR